MAEWSSEEQEKIITDYERTQGVVYCPIDDALLADTRGAHRGGLKAVVLRCPRCGRTLSYQGAGAT